MMKENLSEKKLVISATTSHRRKAALSQIPNIDLHSHPGPERELDHADLSLVAEDKNEYLMNMLNQAREHLVEAESESISEEHKHELIKIIAPAILAIVQKIIEYDSNFQVIGGDTRTDIPNKRKNKIYFESKGKPVNDEEVQKHFWQMNHIGESVYRVFSGSHIRTYNSEYNMPVDERHTQKIIVRLRPELLKFFSTDKGFYHYKRAFEEFYQSETYQAQNLPSAKMQDLSGGFSLPVFMKEKAIEAVSFDGAKEVHINDMSQDFLKKIIYLVAVGYSPAILDRIFPGAHQLTIDNWQWLKEVTKEILPDAKK